MTTSTDHDHDHGDENDGDSPPWRTFRIKVGKTLCYWPRSWREEEVPALPDRNPGDEDQWHPLSEVSAWRLLQRLGFK